MLSVVSSTSPLVGTPANPYYEGFSYYGVWDQKDNNGNQVPPGQYSIGDLNFTITNSYYVKSYYPNAKPSTYYIFPGNNLSFSGSGFAPHETVLFYHGNYKAEYRADSMVILH